MGSKFINYVGIIAIVLGAVLLSAAALVPGMGDLCDNNIYVVGSTVLIIVGIIAHILINKYIVD